VKTELVEIKLHCDSIITRSYITRSPRGSQIFVQYKCQQTIAVYTMQAVKIALPVYFLAKFRHQLIFPEAVSTGHSIYNN